MLKGWFGRKPRDTTVDEGAFYLQLPGAWTRLVDAPDERWNYRTDREQVTVSLMGTDHRLSQDERVELLSAYMASRREAEVAGVEADLSETAPAAAGEVNIARYEGREDGADRWFSCLVMVTPLTVLTFYYEALGMPYETFAARGRTAFNTIGLREPRP